METGNKKHKETSLYIRQNRITPAEIEMSHGQAKSQIKEQVLNAYLNFYSDSMENKPNGSQKTLIKFSLLTLSVVILGGALLFFTQDSDKSENVVATILKAAITYQEGDVEVMLEDGRWVDLGSESTLEEGDSFRIVGEGKGILTLDDGSAVRLASDTTINLTSMDPKNIVITNEAGEVYTRVDKSDRTFVVKTADATYTSLGTAYKTVNKTDKKGVYVYESKVEVKPTNIDKVIVNEGEKYFLNEEKQTIAYEDVVDAFSTFNKEKDKEEFGAEAATFTNLEKQKIEQDKTAKDKEKTETPAPQPTPAPANASISLGGNADANAGGISLNWVPSNVDTSQGFKVVFSKTNSNPTFGIDEAIYINDSNARNTFIKKSDGNTYYFRVCRYTGNGCDTYSNVMAITAPGTQKQTGGQAQAPVSTVSAISLSQYAENKVGWTMNGTASQGVKVVWSKNSGPTYPVRSGDNAYYNGETGNSYQYLDAFSGAGTYYVRVCEYTGSGCNVYSNEIAIQLK